MLPLTNVETIVDLNQLYFDHQLLVMQAAREACPERQYLHRQGAALIAGRIGCMQGAMGAGAARAWARAAAADSDSTGRPPLLLHGPPRVPHDWRATERRAGI